MTTTSSISTIQSISFCYVPTSNLVLVTCSGRRKRANTILSGADGGLDSDIRDVKVEPIGYYDLSLGYVVSFGLMFFIKSGKVVRNFKQQIV